MITTLQRGLAALVLAFAATPPVQAAADYLLRLDGVDGSTNAGPCTRRCWIDVLGLSILIPAPDGSTAMKPMSFVAMLDPDQSRAIMDSAATGKTLSAMVQARSGTSVADDVIVDGRIITAENVHGTPSTFAFSIGDYATMQLRHWERGPNGNLVQTAAGAYGVQGFAGYSGQPEIFDALYALGARRQSDGSLQLATAVPEPSTYALLLGGLGMLALVRWRRSA